MNDLRKEFWEEIYKMAKRDKTIIVLTGDLGFSFCEKFQKDLFKQFINCGIAEQNMIGVAAGLSYEGFKPYCYSNVIFLLSRAHEFVRNDIAYNNTNVHLIGTGAAGFLGFTHNWEKKENEEDLLKNLPNIKRFYPQGKKELLKALKIKGPSFIRL